MKLISKKIERSGFSLIELMLVVVLAGLLGSSIYGFLNKQRRSSTRQRLKANIESMTQISFFIIGRDIRRAGSNPQGIACDPIVRQ